MKKSPRNAPMVGDLPLSRGTSDAIRSAGAGRVLAGLRIRVMRIP